MSSLLGRLGLKREMHRPGVPSVAEIVAASQVPVHGLDGEVMDLRFRGFTYSPDEVELLFQRPTKLDFAPGIRIGSCKTDGSEPERFVDMLIRAAAQAAALEFGTDKLREAARPLLKNPDNPFALLDQFPLSGGTEFVQLGSGAQGSALVWKWQLPQPLRAMALGEKNPIIVAAYDLSTENVLNVLRSAIPINDRPDLIEAYQAAFDVRRRARYEGPDPA